MQEEKKTLRERLLELNPATVFLFMIVATLALVLHFYGVESQGTINIGQVIALTIFAFICGLDYIWVTPTGIWRPTISGTVAGIILGNPLLGLVTGSLIEFSFLGLFTIGGGTVPEAASGTIVAVTLGHVMGIAPTKLAVAALVPIAIPVAALTMNIEILVRAGDAVFTHWADREIEKGNFDAIGWINIIGAVPWALSRAIPVAIFAALGANEAVANALSAWIQSPDIQPIWNAMGVAGWFMPALGVGILLRIFYRAEHLPYFVWGFILVAYFGISLLATALFSMVLVGAVYIARWIVQFGELKMPTSEGAGGAKVLSKEDINKAFWNSWFIQSSWNYERMMGTGYAHGMLHIEKKLRKDPEELKEWLTMHSEFYNTEPHLHNIILGMTISLEEQGADIETIRGIKTALMGPFAGLGDSIMWFTILPIAFAIGASIGLEGSFLGPFIAFIIWVGLSWPIKYYSTVIGYEYGGNLSELLKGDFLKFFRDAVAAFAVAMMGGIGASYVTPPAFVTVTFVFYGVSIQAVLDSIIPRLLALLVVLYAWWMVRKGVSLTWSVTALFFTGAGLALWNVIGPAGATFAIPSLLYFGLGLLFLLIAAFAIWYGKKE
ncbi:MAG: PTS system mannose/fructose/sorbose family transporter subunit IID [Candidatus Njordarchaeia archaeon]